jgi:anthranilate synthase component 1
VSYQTRLLFSTDSGQQALPDLTAFNRYNSQRYPYLLFSSATKQNNTQFDILIACPQSRLTLNADKTLSHVSLTDKALNIAVDNDSGFFNNLEKLYQQDKLSNTSKEKLPFTGGWFVYLAYEMAEEIEPRLSLSALPAKQPLAIAARCPAAIIIDKTNNQCLAVVESDYVYLLDEIEQDYKYLASNAESRWPELIGEGKSEEKIELESLIESDELLYLSQVKKIKQYILDGDIFQANLSRQWQAKLKQDIEDTVLIQALARNNPSSFAAMACLQDMTIISSSPERLVSLKDGIVETRPIAGTRPRDVNQASDEALAKELLAHPKERAEHIMLIDLERNDLGRVCRPGSIEVNELMTLESWQHVHHIVSNVRGELERDKTPVDVLRAVFPGGTITGCPKVRCMEILAEMEQQARGAYTGSLGYINRDGSMDFNILIRTMVREGNTITFRAGGGIVNDSIAEKELEETRAKVKGLLKIFR